MTSFDPQSTNLNQPPQESSERDYLSEMPPEIQNKIMKLAGSDGLNLASANKQLYAVGKEHGAIAQEKLKHILNTNIPVNEKVKAIAEILKSEGVDFSVEDNRALRLAAAAGDAQMIKDLLAKSSVKNPIEHNYEAFNLACQTGNVEEAKLILEKIDLSKNVLACAKVVVSSGNQEILKTILLRKNLTSDDINDLLRTAIENNKTALIPILLEDERAIPSEQLLYEAYAHGLKDAAVLIQTNKQFIGQIKEADLFIAKAMGGTPEDIQAIFIAEDPGNPISKETYIQMLHFSALKGNISVLGELLQHFETKIPENERKVVLADLLKSAISSDCDLVNARLYDLIHQHISKLEITTIISGSMLDNLKNGKFNLLLSNIDHAINKELIKDPIKYSAFIAKMTKENLKSLLKFSDVNLYKNILKIIENGPCPSGRMPAEEQLIHMNKPNLEDYNKFINNIYVMLLVEFKSDPELNVVIDQIIDKINNLSIPLTRPLDWDIINRWKELNDTTSFEKLLNSNRKFDLFVALDQIILSEATEILKMLISNSNVDLKNYKIQYAAYVYPNSMLILLDSPLKDQINLAKLLEEILQNHDINMLKRFFEKIKDHEIWTHDVSALIDVAAEYRDFRGTDSQTTYYSQLEFIFINAGLNNTQKKELIKKMFFNHIAEGSDRSLYKILQLGAGLVDESLVIDILNKSIEDNSFKALYYLIYYADKGHINYKFTKEQRENILKLLTPGVTLGLEGYLLRDPKISADVKDNFKKKPGWGSENRYPHDLPELYNSDF